MLKRNIQLDLFYLDSSNNIVQASHTNTKSSTAVSLVQTGIIQSGTNVNPSSSLAAIYMDAAYGWRVYYQTTSRSIQELVGGNGWNTGTTLGSGLSGTAITVAMISVPNLNLFYIDSSSGSLYFMAFTGSWSARSSLSPFQPFPH
jgi:Fungal fucose-specific lectin